MAGTQEDARLMVELAQWGSTIGLDAASRRIFSDDFDPDSVEALDEDIRSALVWYETIGTLVKNDLLNRDLVYDWLWVSGAWDRVGPAAKRAREKAGVAALWANFEALAAGQAG
jgi:hypothetical protein